MIQRKQSLYLLIVSVLGFLMIFANPKYAYFEDSKETQKSIELHYTTTTVHSGDVSNNVAKWINILLLGFVGTGSLMTIFLFRKTELQKKICIYLTLIEALLIIVMVLDYNTAGNQLQDSNAYPGIWSAIPLVLIVLSFLSWRAIRKDEHLLKSMDRIR